MMLRGVKDRVFFEDLSVVEKAELLHICERYHKDVDKAYREICSHIVPYYGPISAGLEEDRKISKRVRQLWNAYVDIADQRGFSKELFESALAEVEVEDV